MANPPKTKKSPSKASPDRRKAPKGSRLSKRNYVLHSLDGSGKQLVRFEWNDALGDFAGTLVDKADELKGLTESHPPFCKPDINNPSRKYYCEFYPEYNQYRCIPVPANDPRCP